MINVLEFFESTGGDNALPLDVCDPLAEASHSETEVTATPCTTTAGSPQASPQRTQPKRSTLDKVCYVWHQLQTGVTKIT